MSSEHPVGLNLNSGWLGHTSRSSARRDSQAEFIDATKRTNKIALRLAIRLGVQE